MYNMHRNRYECLICYQIVNRGDHRGGKWDWGKGRIYQINIYIFLVSLFL